MSPPTWFGLSAASSARGACGPREDEVAEARREPLDLALDRRGDVEVRAVRHVAVRPQRVPTCRRAGRIGHAGLRRRCRTGARRGVPRATSASAAATSSSVPPTWTVPARRHASAAHGTGPDSAQSTLHTAGPYR